MKNFKPEVKVGYAGLFIFLFFVTLGPKFSGFLDSSVIFTTMMSSFFLLINRGNFYLNIRCFYFLLMFVCIAVYAYFLQLFFLEFDLQTILRFIKSIIIYLNILIFVFYLSKRVDLENIYMAILYLTILNAILILLSIASSSVMHYISFLSGNKLYNPFRASGLFAGYDIAGFFNLIGMYICFVLRTKKSNYFVFPMFSLLFVANVFTSRLSIFLSIILLIYFVSFIFIKSNNFFLKLSVLLVFSCLIIYSYEYIIAVLYYTLSFDTSQFDPIFITALEQVFAQDSLSVLYDMYLIPIGELHFLFGQGSYLIHSDVGFVRDIQRIGFLGLVFYLIVLFSMFLFSSRIEKSSVLNFIFIMMVVFSFKNEFFFSRGVFPLFLFIIIFISDRAYEKDTFFNKI